MNILKGLGLVLLAFVVSNLASIACEKWVGSPSGFVGATLGLSVLNFLVVASFAHRKEGFKAGALCVNLPTQLLCMAIAMPRSNWDSDIGWPKHLPFLPVQAMLISLLVGQVILLALGAHRKAPTGPNAQT